MKTLLLAAAAVIAMPALAQTQSGTSMPDSAAPAQPTTPPADTMQAPTTPPPPADTMAAPTAAPAPAPAPGSDPVGGYQPAAPALSGPVAPGTTVTFRPAPTPDQAYPAPAPLASYPVCRPGQFDKCVQGPRSTHSRQVRGRPSR